MFGQLLRITYRRTNQTVSANLFHQTMPVHIAMPKPLFSTQLGTPNEAKRTESRLSVFPVT